MNGVLLINTRTDTVLRCADCAELALSNPELLGISREEVLGLSVPRDRNKLVVRALTARWLRVHSARGRGLLLCDGADTWPHIFHSVKVAIQITAQPAGALVRLNNLLYDAAIVAPEWEWASLDNSGFTQFIRRAVRMQKSDRIFCAAFAKTVMGARQSAIIRQEDAERERHFETLCAVPRSEGVEPARRASQRLVPWGPSSFHPPDARDSSVVPVDLAVLDRRLCNLQWALVVRDGIGMDVRSFRKLSYTGQPETRASAILAEVIDEHRIHVAWVYAYLVVPLQFPEFGSFITKRAMGTASQVLLRDGGETSLFSRGKPQTVSAVSSVIEAEILLSRELYSPWSIEFIGGYAMGQWVFHQSTPQFYRPLAWTEL